MSWHNVQKIHPVRFRCGFCDDQVANDKGYFASLGDRLRYHIYLCPGCDKPTFFDESGRQFPGVPFGEKVNSLPAEVDALYLEARNACSVAAFTSAVLACRKILMNVAVEQGAPAGLKFIEYVDHLANTGLIPPNSRGWVDHIRKKGNEATHEIAMMSKADATELMALTEMLLKIVYEFPRRVPTT
ncbi:MAG: DUF4145 domain-containing protein [Planctomycetales bacterium]|nr:DUF4145 domain-containing protein [Planctomycetales bacterium]